MYFFENDYCILGLWKKNQNKVDADPLFGKSLRNIFKKKKNAHFRMIKKGMQFKVLIDGELTVDASIKGVEWAKEIMIPGKPILIQIDSGSNSRMNFALDNLYIGSPKPIKKPKKKK